jgi:hypothetical protein
MSVPQTREPGSEEMGAKSRASLWTQDPRKRNWPKHKASAKFEQGGFTSRRRKG